MCTAQVSKAISPRGLFNREDGGPTTLILRRITRRTLHASLQLLGEMRAAPGDCFWAMRYVTPSPSKITSPCQASAQSRTEPVANPYGRQPAARLNRRIDEGSAGRVRARQHERVQAER